MAKAIENLEPNDFLMKEVLPGIVPEHIARYEFAREIIDRIAIDRQGPLNVLNLGSARGYGSDILSRGLPKEVIGVELNHKYSVSEVEKYEGHNPITADASKIPLDSGSVEAVVAFELIEHLPKKNQPTMIEEISRVLKPNGMLIISFPERYSFDENGERTGLWNNSNHLYEPKPDEVKNYLAGAGLTIESELGQIPKSPEALRKMKKIADFLPVWPIFAWGRKKDTEVAEIKDKKIPLTHVYVARKL